MMNPVARLGAVTLLSLVLTGLGASATRMPTDLGAKLASGAMAIRADPAALAVTTTTSTAPKKTPLSVFQVAQPVLGPDGPVYQSLDGKGGSKTVVAPGVKPAESCTQVIMEYSFGNSYGHPFVGPYTPPSCAFNRVIMNFTVTSSGRQFDRLALMYFGDTEVWRTSTAEPKAPPGIEWTYWKDMTEYLYFWKQPQTVIFDLGNLINDLYTGYFNATLTATFFTSDVDVGQAPPADLILPVSAGKGSSGAASAFNVPQDDATVSLTLPRNVRRAVFSVSANGQQNEEFWWSNVLESDVWDFNATAGGPFTGLSPWREVRVSIDGQLAGVQWPFPVIFTGGVVPSFHRPVVGLDAFDLREHEIDITPWLPILCDGKAHDFRIVVGGFNDSTALAKPEITDAVASYWVVTGKVFVWLDEAGSVTTGDAPIVAAPPPAINFAHQIYKNASGVNESLTYSIDVRRDIVVTGRVVTSKGTEQPVWRQALTYKNVGAVTGFGNDGVNTFNLSGTDDATSAGVKYSTSYSYPLFANSTYTVDAAGDFSIAADLYQGLDLVVEGAAVFPTGLEAFAELPRTQHATFSASSLSTFRRGSAYIYQTGDGKNGTAYGNIHQKFAFGGISAAGSLGSTPDIGLYLREVSAANDTVTSDEQYLADVQTGQYSAPGGKVPGQFAAPKSMKGLRVLGTVPPGDLKKKRDGGIPWVKGQRLLV